MFLHYLKFAQQQTTHNPSHQSFNTSIPSENLLNPGQLLLTSSLIALLTCSGLSPCILLIRITGPSSSIISPQPLATTLPNDDSFP